MHDIQIIGAREGNLQNLSLTIPRHKLTVLTGPSGSGKSTLAMDVLYMECQRQHLETLAYQGYVKPKVDAVRYPSAAILIAQEGGSRNPRSTVGTVTNLYTELRMVYDKLAVRPCPHCAELISAADCAEELEKRPGGEFTVYMTCRLCGLRMEKLTRTHFSHNTREGACPTCQGLGRALSINESALFHEELSLRDGAVDYWEGKYRDYCVDLFFRALAARGIPLSPDAPLRDFPPEARELLRSGSESPKFEGVCQNLWRRMAEKGGEAEHLKRYFLDAPCPDCHGERLAPLSRSATVAGIRLPELAVLSLEELRDYLAALERKLAVGEKALVAPYLSDLDTKLRRLINVGLGYLSLDRQTMTLSGGEERRMKLAAALDSEMTGVLYLLDEPTTGLHPMDTAGMVRILKDLRDIGNTLVVIEHDVDVMREADFLADLGPGAGRQGGHLVASGTLGDLMNSPGSATGAWLRKGPAPLRAPRAGSGSTFGVRGAAVHNLKHLDLTLRAGQFTVVTGLSGSGKSTLVFDCLTGAESESVGLEQFTRVVTVEQAPPARMKRSNVATYLDFYTHIRKLFSALPQAKEAGLTARDFSFNTPGGRCETCEGMGSVNSNMLFFSDLEIPCPECGGARFQERVLAVEYQGHSIRDVLDMTVEEATPLFQGSRPISATLGLLMEVGLGYLGLGQSLTTLSGGEGQRLKLARELLDTPKSGALYLIDEPTAGLHPTDVEHFLTLIHALVDAGGTVVCVEHDLQVIAAADHIVDLGPGGGVHGGEIVFEGTPKDLLDCPDSATGAFLKRYLSKEGRRV